MRFSLLGSISFSGQIVLQSNQSHWKREDCRPSACRCGPLGKSRGEGGGGLSVISSKLSHTGHWTMRFVRQGSVDVLQCSVDDSIFLADRIFDFLMDKKRKGTILGFFSKKQK